MSSSIESIIDSLANITPRGVNTPISSSSPSKMLDYICLPKSYEKQNDQLSYAIYSINGKKCMPLIRSICLARAF